MTTEPVIDFPEVAEIVLVSRVLTHRYEGESDLEWRDRALKETSIPGATGWALCRPGDEPWHKRLIV